MQDVDILREIVRTGEEWRSHTHLLGCPPIASRDDETARVMPHERGHEFCGGWAFCLCLPHAPAAFYAALDIAFTASIRNKCFSAGRKHELLNVPGFLQKCGMDVVDTMQPPFLPAPFSPDIEALPTGRKNRIGITKKAWDKLRKAHNIALELDIRFERWTQGGGLPFSLVMCCTPPLRPAPSPGVRLCGRRSRRCR